MDLFHFSSLKHHISPLSTTTVLSLKHPSAFCNGEHLFAVIVFSTFLASFSTTSAQGDAYTTHDVVSDPKASMERTPKKKVYLQIYKFFHLFYNEDETNRMH